MTEIVEAMARAIGKKRYGWSWEETCDQLQQDMREDARAALTAALDCMQEPSEGMVDAGEELDERAADYSGYSEIPATCEKHWQAMLDQLRKEALDE